MRSNSRMDPGQMSLWEEPIADATRPPRGRSGTDARWQAHEVSGGEFLSRGWGAGTLLYYAPARRADRGAIAVVQVGEQKLVGEVVVELGRLALRTDHGVVWLGPHTRVVGVVRMIEPPLPLPAGVPESAVAGVAETQTGAMGMAPS